MGIQMFPQCEVNWSCYIQNKKIHYGRTGIEPWSCMMIVSVVRLPRVNSRT